MQTAKNLRVSVVIPTYNEELRIADCLRALRTQTVKPFEIIVIDNNSSDQTVSIVEQFPEVRIVHETQQGLSHARNTGLNAARGEILARIDADTYVDAHWIEAVQSWFMLHPDHQAVTGIAWSRVGITSKTIGHLWSFAYYLQSRGVFGIQLLWGANMALRADAWRKARTHCILNDKMVHEDQDLSLALASVGIRAHIHSRMSASIDFGDTQYIEKTWEYTLRKYSTLRMHNRSNRNEFEKYNPAIRALCVLITTPLALAHVVVCLWNSGMRALRRSARGVRRAYYTD